MNTLSPLIGGIMSSGVVGFVALIAYSVLFVMGQSFVAARTGIRQIQRGESILRLLVSMVGLSLMVPAAGMMKDAPMALPSVIVGAAITLYGWYVSVTAQYKLGQNWVGGIGLHEKHKLVQGGPYRYVRHPMYSGMIVSAIGLGLIGWNVLFAVSALCIFGNFALRIPAEEKLLAEKFGKKWQVYAKTTGMLIPRFRKGR